MKKMAVSLLVATLFAAPLFAQEPGKPNSEQHHQMMLKHHQNHQMMLKDHDKHDQMMLKHHDKHDKKEMPRADTKSDGKTSTTKNAQ